MTRTSAIAAVLAAVGLMVGGQQVLAEPPTDAPAALSALKVAPAAAVDYDGDAWGEWRDLDKDCLDTRAEVLVLQLADEVLDGCKVVSGTFRDPYTGIQGEALASRLDIDHVVAQADAARSGGQAWSEARKIAFTNDLSNLLATNSTANRCKSDKGPAEWDLPVIVGSRVCDRQRAPRDGLQRHDYACIYIATKVRWGLTVTPKDRDALARMLLPNTAC